MLIQMKQILPGKLRRLKMHLCIIQHCIHATSSKIAHIRISALVFMIKCPGYDKYYTQNCQLSTFL